MDNNILISNILNSKNRYFPGHNNEKTASLEGTGAKPDNPKGTLVKSGIISSITDLPADYYEAGKTIAKGVQGKGTDHSYGEMNYALNRITGLGIAAYLLTKRNSLLEKSMEVVGFGTFFAAMSLFPKVFIEKPLEKLTGVNIGQKYTDSYGRKKRFYQDPQYLPWDLMPQKKLDEIGKKNDIPEDAPDRQHLIKEKAKQIAIQGNTLWMLGAGIATPIGSALGANLIEKKVVPVLLNKYYDKKSQISMDTISSEADKLVNEKQKQAYVSLVPSKGSMSAEQKEVLSGVFQNKFQGSEISVALNQDLENILKNAERTPEASAISDYVENTLFSNEVVSDIRNSLTNQEHKDILSSEFLQSFKDNVKQVMYESPRDSVSDFTGIIQPALNRTVENMEKATQDDKIDYNYVSQFRESIKNKMEGFANKPEQLTNEIDSYFADFDKNCVQAPRKQNLSAAAKEPIDYKDIKEALHSKIDLLDDVDIDDKNSAKEALGRVLDKLNPESSMLAQNNGHNRFKNSMTELFENEFSLENDKITTALKTDFDGSIEGFAKKASAIEFNKKEIKQPFFTLVSQINMALDAAKVDQNDKTALDALKESVAAAKGKKVNPNTMSVISESFANKVDNFGKTVRYEIDPKTNKALIKLYEYGEALTHRIKLFRTKKMDPKLCVTGTPDSISASLYQKLPNKIVQALKLPNKTQKALVNAQFVPQDSQEANALMSYFKELTSGTKDAEYGKVVNKLMKTLKEVADLDQGNYTKTITNDANKLLTPYVKPLETIGATMTQREIELKNPGSFEQGRLIKLITNDTEERLTGAKFSFYKIIKLLDISEQENKCEAALLKGLKGKSQEEIKKALESNDELNLLKAAKEGLLMGNLSDYAGKFEEVLQKNHLTVCSENHIAIFDKMFTLSDSIKARMVPKDLAEEPKKAAQALISSIQSANESAKQVLGNIYNSKHANAMLGARTGKSLRAYTAKSVSELLQDGSNYIQSQKTWRKRVGIPGAVLIGATLLAQFAFGKDNKYNPKISSNGGTK